MNWLVPCPFKALGMGYVMDGWMGGWMDRRTEKNSVEESRIKKIKKKKSSRLKKNRTDNIYIMICI